MAISVVSTDVSILEKSMYGYNGFNLSSMADGAAPTVTGYCEAAGALYFANAETPDTGGNFAGIAADTIFYGFIDGAGLNLYVDDTAPVYSVAKNGYYHSVDTTDRCYAQFYKSGGLWTQRTLIHYLNYGVTEDGVNLGIGANADRSIRLASDASISWDEANDYIEADKPIDNTEIATYKSQDGGADVQIATYTGAASGTDFTIKKPISGFMTTSATFGIIQIKVNGTYYNTVFLGTNLGFILNPGTYRIANSDAGTTTLYAVGVYGNTTVTLADIVA